MPERRGRPSPEKVQNLAQFEPGQKTRDIAAERAGFGNPETARQAEAVVRNGVPELIEAMDAGEIAISTAAQIARLPAETQQQVAAEPETAPAVAKAAKQARSPKPKLVSEEQALIKACRRRW